MINIFAFIVLFIASVVGCLAMCYCLILLATIIRGVPYIRIDSEYQEKAIAQLAIEAGDRIVDLGCGDGKVLKKIAKDNTDVEVFGVENNFWVYLMARINCRKYKNIKIYWESISNMDLNYVNKIYTYLYPEAMDLVEIDTIEGSFKWVSAKFDFSQRFKQDFTVHNSSKLYIIER